MNNRNLVKNIGKKTLVKHWLKKKKMVKNIVGKGENAGYQHFLHFPQCFQKVPFIGVIKSLDCMVKN